MAFEFATKYKKTSTNMASNRDFGTGFYGSGIPVQASNLILVTVLPHPEKIRLPSTENS
jgi:hypothetical protein